MHRFITCNRFKRIEANFSCLRKIHVLGIESSCDDTGVAIVDHEGKVLSNCVHSQLESHLNHGGIIPVVAKEYHVRNIDRVANEAFAASGLSSVANDIDAIAVTTRPGLEGSLQVGLNYAKKLAAKYSKPLIPIHHMQAHALMPTLANPDIKFPFLALLISGGHCLLAIAKQHDEFHLLGASYDEAPGDLLDKFARRHRLRDLGPPFDKLSGGAAIETLARRPGTDRFRYFNNSNAIPMNRRVDCDFSFTGYRDNYALFSEQMDELWFRSDREALMKELGDMCASLQRGILIQLSKKVHRAVKFYQAQWRHMNMDAFADEKRNSIVGHKLRHYQSHNDDEDSDQLDLLISGGVAANSYLTEGIKLLCREVISTPVRVHVAPRSYCSDNGLMIAWNGMLKYRHLAGDQSRGFGEAMAQYPGEMFSAEHLDLVQVEAISPIGEDIRQLVRTMGSSPLPKNKHPEFVVKE